MHLRPGNVESPQCECVENETQAFHSGYCITPWGLFGLFPLRMCSLQDCLQMLPLPASQPAWPSGVINTAFAKLEPEGLKLAPRGLKLGSKVGTGWSKVGTGGLKLRSKVGTRGLKLESKVGTRGYKVGV